MKSIAVFALVLPLLSSVESLAKEGVVLLNTKKTHLYFSDHGTTPKLEFRALKNGPVKIRLDEKGAFIGTQLVCSWPKGKYESKDEPNMVLGYSTPTYTPCPVDLPIKSTWGDGGTGVAALYVEVEKVEAERAEVKFRGETLELNLSGLKGKYEIKKPGSLSNAVGD
jgi:hypothetical protein